MLSRFAALFSAVLLAQTPQPSISTSGWHVALAAIPPGEVRASSVRLRVTITNDSGSAAYLLAGAIGADQGYHVEVLDVRTGLALSLATCVDNIYSTAHYNTLVQNGSSVNEVSPLSCFARITHSSTFNIRVTDISLSNEYQGDLVAVAHVRSNVLRLKLEP